MDEESGGAPASTKDAILNLEFLRKYLYYAKSRIEPTLTVSEGMLGCGLGDGPLTPPPTPPPIPTRMLRARPSWSSTLRFASALQTARWC